MNGLLGTAYGIRRRQARATVPRTISTITARLDGAGNSEWRWRV